MNEVEFDIVKFAERLKELMDDFRENTQTLYRAIFLTPPTISKYMNASLEPKRSTVELLARYFGVNPVWLMGQDVDKYLPGQIPKNKCIPFIESANYDNKIDNYKFVPIEENIDLCLLVPDNSMINARIYEGDLAYIREQLIVENGEIAAIVINEVITLKRIYIKDNSLVLHSENPTLPDIIIAKKEKKKITILGKVIYVKFEVR
jgi:repressor LexA